MADDSILGSISSAAFLGTSYVAGREVYRNIKEARQTMDRTKNAYTNSKSRMVNFGLDDTLYKSNIADLGMTGFRYKPVTTTVASNEIDKLISFLPSGMHGSMKDLNKTLLKTGRSFNYTVKQNADNMAAELMLNYKGENLSLGKMSYGNIIKHANSTHSGRISAVPNFIDFRGTEAIYNGNVNLSDVLHNNVIDFNTARISAINRNLESIGTRSSVYDITNKIKSTVNYFNSFAEDTNGSNFRLERKANSLAMLFWGENGLHKLEVGDREGITKRLARNFYEGFEHMAGAKVNPTFGVYDKLGNAIFTNPLSDSSVSSIFNKLAGQGRIVPGHKKLEQMLTKESSFVNPAMKNFYSQYTKDIAQHANIGSIETLYVPHGNKLFDSILAHGINGLPHHRLEEEGAFMTNALLKERLIEPHHLTIPIPEDGAGHITVDMERFMDDLVTFHANGRKVTTSMRSNQPFNISRDPDLLAQLRNERIKKFRTIINNKEDGKLLSDFGKALGHGDKFDAVQYFGKHTPLYVDKTRKIFIGDIASKEIINNLSLDENGLRFHRNANYAFSETGKIWGTGKILNTGNTDKDLAFLTMALDKEKVAPKNVGKYLTPKGISRLKRKYSKLYGSLNDRMMITSMGPRSMPFGNDISKLTKMEQLAWAKSLDPNSDLYQYARRQVGGDSIALAKYISSTDSPNTLSGFSINTKVAVNSIQANRLRAMGLKSAANFIEQSFDVQGYNNAIKSLSPMWGATTKDHIGLPIDSLTRDDISVLYGDNLGLARKRAEELAQNIMRAKTSEATQFYIDLANDTNRKALPIPLYDSRYTLGVNQYRLDEPGEPILARLTSRLKNAANFAREGKTSSLNKMWYGLEKEVGRVLDPQQYTKVIHKDAQIATIAGNFTLSDDYMNKLIESGVSKERLQKVLDQYGLKLGNIDNSSVLGMSSKRFQRLVDDMELKGNPYEQMKDSWMIAGRDPAYVGEGFSMYRGLDEERFARDILSLTGRDQSVINRYIASNVRDDTIHGPLGFHQKASVDTDKDPIKMIGISDPELRKLAAEEHGKMDTFLSSIYGNKGTIKSGSGKTVENVLEMAMTEKEGISRTYNQALRYASPLNSMEGLTDSGGLTADKKRKLMNHFIVSIPEKSIGAKDLATEESLNNILDIFDHERGLSLEDRATKLSDLFSDYKFQKDWGDFKIGDSVLSAFSPKDFKAVLASGDDISGIIHQGLKGGIKSIAGMRQFIETKGSGIGHLIEEANLRTLNMASTETTTKKMLTSFGDISEDVLRKLYKNKTVRVLGATSILAGLLLRGPDKQIGQQEVRESSRPKPRIPRGADAIDPATGTVGQDRLHGYKLSVRGTAPSGKSIADIRTSLGKMGMAPQNTYINSNQLLDSHYIKQLQNEDKSNKWNQR